MHVIKIKTYFGGQMHLQAAARILDEASKLACEPPEGIKDHHTEAQGFLTRRSQLSLFVAFNYQQLHT